MVFNLSSKKKKHSKIPKLSSQVKIQTNSHQNVTVTNNVILTPPPSNQDFTDSSLYKRLSSNRAIFESHKLESACSFLKCLKEKLEKDVIDPKDKQLKNSPSATIPGILDTLIDVSDNLAPMVNDVTNSAKSIYTASETSSISEKHFNKTMAATNKLLQLTTVPGRITDSAYYFAHKIVASSNVEELTIFKNNIQTIGDKIYIDKDLLTQLIELHRLLKDTILKLKGHEEDFLSQPSAKSVRSVKSGDESHRSGSNIHESRVGPSIEQPVTSTPRSGSVPQFAPEEGSDENEADAELYHTAYGSTPANARTKSNISSKPLFSHSSVEPEDVPQSKPLFSHSSIEPEDVPQSKPLFPHSSIEPEGVPQSKPVFAHSSIEPEDVPQGMSSAPPETPKKRSGTSSYAPSAISASHRAVKLKKNEASSVIPKNARSYTVEVPSDEYDLAKEINEEIQVPDERPISEIKMEEVLSELLGTATITPPVTPVTPRHTPQLSREPSKRSYVNQGSSVTKIEPSEISEKLYQDRATEMSCAGLRTPAKEHSKVVKVRKIIDDPVETDAATCCGEIEPEPGTRAFSTMTQTQSSRMDSKKSQSRSRGYSTVVQDPISKTDGLKSQIDANDSDPISQDLMSRTDGWKSQAGTRTGSTVTQAPPSRTDGWKSQIDTNETMPQDPMSRTEGGKPQTAPEGMVLTRFASPLVSKRNSFQTKQTGTQFWNATSKNRRTQTTDKPADECAEGLEKCLAELECMRNCLSHSINGRLHDCIRVFPEDEDVYIRSNFPHFHTVINGVPMVIQFTKRGIPVNNAYKDKNVSCCQEECTVPTIANENTCCRPSQAREIKQALACRVWGSLAKSAQDKMSPKNWASKKWSKYVLKSGKTSEKGDSPSSGTKNMVKGKRAWGKSKKGISAPRDSAVHLKASSTESSGSLPYVADTNSLPKIDDPDKICSSLQFDVTEVPVTFENSVLYHPNEIVNNALKDITVEQLLDSFRPAKCCRKAVINQKHRSKMPYAASLQSLPLLQGDLNIMKRIIMQSNVPALFKTNTLFEHYINFQKNIMSSCNKDKSVTPTSHVGVSQVYFFEIFKKDEEDKSKEQSAAGSSSSNTFNDKRILDFIKKIYTSEPIYHKVSRKHRQEHDDDIKENNVENEKKERKEGNEKSEGKEKKEKKDKRREKKEHSNRTYQNLRKYKKIESTTCYSSVESYLASKSNLFLNTSSSSQVSSKFTRSRNSNSMYSFLLLPKSELNTSTSNNDLSTSYAPSVTSLPFEDDLSCKMSNSNRSTVTVQAYSDDSDEWLLSPGNYAKTLDGIYELDENGNIRPKTTMKESKAKAVQESPPFETLYDPSGKVRNLTTIYEADEKNVTKESEANIYSKPVETYFINKHRALSSQISIAISCGTKIPVRINSFSNRTVGKERLNSPIQLPKSPTESNSTIVYNTKSDNTKSAENMNMHNTLPYNSSYNKKSEKIKCVDSSTSTDDIQKHFVARVHPKVLGRTGNIKSDVTVKRPVELQRALDGTNNFELPLTFEILTPTKKKNRKMSIETKVMSYDCPIVNKQLEENVKCYRSENICAWPQIPKKFESANKAFYISVHDGQRTALEKLGEPTSQAQVLQQHPHVQRTQHNETHSSSAEKTISLTNNNFMIGYVGSNYESASILKKPAVSDKTVSPKPRRKVGRASSDMIDIKVAKNIKSTKLKHKFFKNGDRPGYVTVLRTPCNCPDITIFLPCCCGQSDCSVSLVRDAQQYAMLPIIEKDETKT